MEINESMKDRCLGLEILLAEHLVVQPIVLTRPYNHVETKRGCRNTRSKPRCPTTTDTQAAPFTAVPCSQTTYRTTSPRTLREHSGLNKYRLLNGDGAYRHRIRLSRMIPIFSTGSVSRVQLKDPLTLFHSTRLGLRLLMLPWQTNSFHSILHQKILQGLGLQGSRHF